MILRLPRQWPLFLLALLVLSHHTVLAKQRSAPKDAAAQAVLSEDGVQQADGKADAVPGALAVRDAQATLSKLKASKRRVSHFSKPQNLLGSIFYYIKELFVLLFVKGTPIPDLSSSKSPSRRLSEPLGSAVRLLEDAASQNNTEAIYTLADLNFYGRFGYPRNITRAFEQYSHVAEQDGNSSALHMLGFMYSTGIGNVVERDQAKAMIHHKYAADSGDTRAQMTMGYRYHAGVGTPRNCEKALRYYKKVAEKAMVWARAGPPGGRQIDKETIRFADDDGGVYGEGASVSSSGRNAKVGGPTTDAHAAFDDVLEYLDLMSRKGDIKATFGLGRLHYEGSRNLPQDYAAARRFFHDVARLYWTKDGKVKSDVENGVERLASKAAGYLGRMYLRGEGLDQDFRKARIWFRRGVDHGDPLCQYSMGIMHLNGLEVEQDPVRAAEYFASAADQSMTSAQVRLGALLLDQGDLLTASKYFDIASQSGHIEAFYYLAEIANIGTQNRERSCSTATVFYKTVAEKAELIHSDFVEANAAYDSGDLDFALIAYMHAAEQGYEIGQANVAYLLDQPHHTAGSHLARYVPGAFGKRRVSSSFSDAELALIYWTRSARQSNVDSLVKMGDYYLVGVGVPTEGVNLQDNQTEITAANAKKAASCYNAAVDTQLSAQAMWNLGWMHENGMGGMAQDFHLAKRYYDQALETNKEAYLPVTLSLMKLRFRSAWNQITGGSAVSIKKTDEDGSARKFSWAEWITRFIQADMEQQEELWRREAAEFGHDDDDWDHPSTAGAGGPGEEYDDLWLDEGLLEFAAIAGLTLALAALLYFRQAQQIRRANHDAERDEEDRRRRDAAPVAAQPDVAAAMAGFPPPGDPAFNQWAAPGGVGH